MSRLLLTLFHADRTGKGCSPNLPNLYFWPLFLRMCAGYSRGHCDGHNQTHSVWIFGHHREKVMSVRLLNSIRVQSLQDAQATFRRLSNTGTFFQPPSFCCCPDSQSNNSQPLIPADIGGFPAVSRKYGERSQKANARPVTDLKLKGMT